MLLLAVGSVSEIMGRRWVNVDVSGGDGTLRVPVRMESDGVGNDVVDWELEDAKETAR